MPSELFPPPGYTWKTFLAFVGLAALVWAILEPILGLWLKPRVAAMAAAGVSVPIAISGNKGWAHPRVLPRVLLALIAMGVAGGFLGAIIAEMLPPPPA